MSSPANGSTAVALIQPSPFDVLPAPPLRARYLRNQRRLQRLSLERLSGQTEAGLQWEAEVARQLGDEGFVVLDGFLGAEGAAQVRAAVVSALESAATAGGLSGGAPCHASPRRAASPLHPIAYLSGTAHVVWSLIAYVFSRAQAGWRGASEVTARCGQHLRPVRGAPAAVAPPAAARRSISCCCGVSTGWSRARCARAWQRRAICAGAATRS